MGVLTQRLGSEPQPVAYLSKRLDPTAQGCPPCLRNLAAIAIMIEDLLFMSMTFLDPEVQTLQSCTIAFGQFQQDICLWGMNQDPKDSKESPLYAPGTQVLIKIWKDGSPKVHFQPTWKGSFPVILSTPTAVKVPGHDSWICYS